VKDIPLKAVEEPILIKARRQAIKQQISNAATGTPVRLSTCIDITVGQRQRRGADIPY
jgi:hypothetical protein